MSEHYSNLNLPRSATLAEVRSSWKKLIVKTHPDKNGGDDEMFQKVQTAYEAITKETKKTPEQKRRDDANRKNAQRRAAYQKRRAEERAAAAQMFARAREERERAAAARAEVETKKREEKQQKERRIAVEGRMEYEARILRERQEAYLKRHEAKRRAFEAERAAGGKAGAGLSWAERQQARHDELLQSRYAKYMAQAAQRPGTHTAQPQPGQQQQSPPRGGGAASRGKPGSEEQTGGGESQVSSQDGDEGDASSADSPPPVANGGKVPRAAQADEAASADDDEEPIIESAFDFFERRRNEAMRSLNTAMNLYPTTSGLNDERALFGLRLAMFER